MPNKHSSWLKKGLMPITREIHKEVHQNEVPMFFRLLLEPKVFKKAPAKKKKAAKKKTAKKKASSKK